jgi:hypothetical protein
MSREPQDPAQVQEAFDAFRKDMDKEFEKSIDGHETKMSIMGVFFLAIFGAVIGIAAILP